MKGYRCVHCSFEHRHRVTRCSMCDKVQFDNDDLANFVRGQPTKRQEQMRAQESLSKPPPSAGSGQSGLSEEQLKRMEANRLKALQIRQQKALERERKANLPGPANNFFGKGDVVASPFSRVPTSAARSNPYARAVVNPYAAVRRRPPQQQQQQHGSGRQQQQQRQPKRQGQGQGRQSTTPLSSAINPFSTAEGQKYVQGPVPIDTDTMHTYIYPTNYEVRKYQQQMTRTALFNNTIICLPTGLGKTLIASCVMYNFDR